MGLHWQENDVEVWRSFTSITKLWWTSPEKISQVQEGKADDSLSQYDSNKHIHCVFCLIGTIEIKRSSWRPGTFHRRPHEPDTVGSRMRDNADSKTSAQVSQEAGFSPEVGKGQYFVTRLSINNSKGPTLVFKEYTLPRSDPHSQLVCFFLKKWAHWWSLGFKDNEFDLGAICS